jgi:hypothetical protein
MKPWSLVLPEPVTFLQDGSIGLFYAEACPAKMTLKMDNKNVLVGMV